VDFGSKTMATVLTVAIVLSARQMKNNFSLD